ncbi:MAG: sugar MFS transporter [Alloprevotella sp.]|nr:sugar MFS transporter [Alloprevotella sp.]
MKLVTTRDGRNYLVPFLLVTSLFFLWGFAHSILDVLNKFFQNEMHLTKTQSAFIQVVVYGGYFLMALPAGAVIRRWGYRAGVLTGLFLYGIGALLFIPGAEIMSFPFFLFSLFVIGCGLTFLETSANPYVTVLGDAEASEQRINFSQSFNGLGWILGPLVGGWFLFSQENSPNIALPYAIIGLVVLLIGGVFCFVRLPEIKDTVSPEEVSGHQDDPRDENRDLSTTTVESSSTLSEIRILSRKSAFVFGWIALFLYVAAQTGVNSFFINYATEHIAITDSMAATLLSFGGMGLFMLGRLGGSWAMGRIRAERLLAILAIIATLATSTVVLAPGGLGFAALLVVYLCESIMFPTIFALALRGLGAHTKIASSLLIMSIVGGAVAPLLMGIVADGHSMALGFVAPLVCFVVIAAYAVTRR